MGEGSGEYLYTRRRMTMDRQANEFELDGKVYEAVKQKQGGCGGCAFKERCADSDQVYCDAEHRDDGRSIIWKERKEESEMIKNQENWQYTSDKKRAVEEVELLEKHMGLHRAIVQLDEVIMQLDDTLARVSGPMPDPNYTAGPADTPVSLADVLNEGPGMIMKKIEQMKDRIRQLNDILF